MRPQGDPQPLRPAAFRVRPGSIAPFISGAVFAVLIVALVWRTQQAHHSTCVSQVPRNGCRFGAQPGMVRKGMARPQQQVLRCCLITTPPTPTTHPDVRQSAHGWLLHNSVGTEGWSPHARTLQRVHAPNTVVGGLRSSALGHMSVCVSAALCGVFRCRCREVRGRRASAHDNLWVCGRAALVRCQETYGWLRRSPNASMGPGGQVHTALAYSDSSATSTRSVAGPRCMWPSSSGFGCTGVIGGSRCKGHSTFSKCRLSMADEPSPLLVPSREPRLHSIFTAVLLTAAAVAGSALVWRTQQPLQMLPYASTVDVRRSSGTCHYGAQPYLFEESGPITFDEAPDKWRLVPLDPACAPRELTAPLLNASRRGEASADRLVIMFFGDR